MAKRGKRASTMGAPRGAAPRSAPRPRSTEAILGELLRRPPRDDAELERRLRGVDPGEARGAIVDRLFDGSVAREAVDLLAAALLVLGVDGQELRLEHTVTDVRRPRADRWTALSLLFSASPAGANRALLGLAPADGLQLTLHPATEAIADVLTEPAAGDTVAEALAGLPDGAQAEGMAFLEEVRRSSGTPAVLVYRELLQREGLDDLQRRALDIIVEEGGVQAAAELIELRDEAGEPASRRALQRALLRLGTRAIEAPAPAPAMSGSAHLGICDGQGAFVVLGCFDNADGTTSIADVCIRAGGPVRDGFAAAGLHAREVETLFRKMRESGLGDLAPIPLSEAAEITLAGVSRTREAGLAIPDDARPAVLLLERALGSAGAGVTPVEATAPPRGKVTLTEARALLALPCYASWLFDAGDLGGAPDPLPARRGKARTAWIDAALARLEGSAAASRLAAMLAHMARWHARRGDARRAALCAAAGQEVRLSFREGALPRAMLERSVEALHAAASVKPGAVGDPERRERIRLQLFADVAEPNGKDLAALDLTEVALFALTQPAAGLVERLPDEELLRAAGAAAAIFVRWVSMRRRGRPEALVTRMEEAIGGLAGLGPGEVGALVALLVPALATFVGEVCEACPVDCLTRPRASVAEAFFSPRHPALG